MWRRRNALWKKKKKKKKKLYHFFNFSLFPLILVLVIACRHNLWQRAVKKGTVFQQFKQKKNKKKRRLPQWTMAKFWFEIWTEKQSAFQMHDYLLWESLLPPPPDTHTHTHTYTSIPTPTLRHPLTPTTHPHIYTVKGQPKQIVTEIPLLTS